MLASRHLLFLMGFLLLAWLPNASVRAATLTWPGAAPCDTTLQACVNAAADNDWVRIATHEPITSNLLITSKRLTLVPADGYRPVFRNAYITASNGAGFNGDIRARLERLRFEQGGVRATYSGTGTAVFEFRQLEITAAPGTSGLTISSQGGSVEATVYDNRISGGPTHSWSGLLDLRASQGGTLEADVFYNRVSRSPSGDGTGAGIFAQYSGAGTDGTVKLHGNTLRGHFRTAGILVAEGSGDNVAPASVNARLYNNAVIGTGHANSQGIRLGVTNGAINVQALNNTVTRVARGIEAGLWASGATSGTMTGMLRNNLVVADVAISISDGLGSGLSNGNNLVNGPTYGLAMDASTITAPARLISHVDARLAPDSPAIDAGDNASLALGLIVNAMPNADADGLRRFKKKTPATSGSARVDVGAYEYGDFSFSHEATLANTSGHLTNLTHPAINNQAAANLFATPYFAGIAGGQPVGTWEFSGGWALYNKTSAHTMPVGARYNVFAAGAGSGVSRHVTTPENISGALSELNLADNPNLIVLAMQNYNAGPIANPNHTGILYFGLGGSGTWFVLNLDTAQPMPANVGFSIYAQAASPNVFAVDATASNMSNSNTLVLDHPLLNGNPCAQPVITRVFTHIDGANFDMEYSLLQKRWVIFDYDGMPVGSRFHVLVNPAQAETCGGEIYSDGFE